MCNCYRLHYNRIHSPRCNIIFLFNGIFCFTTTVQKRLISLPPRMLNRNWWQVPEPHSARRGVPSRRERDIQRQSPARGLAARLALLFCTFSLVPRLKIERVCLFLFCLFFAREKLWQFKIRLELLLCMYRIKLILTFLTTSMFWMYYPPTLVNFLTDFKRRWISIHREGYFYTMK